MSLSVAPTGGLHAQPAWGQRALALIALAFAVLAARDYPWGQPAVAALLALTLVAGLRWPGAWLFLVPAALPLVDFAPWSGRLFLQDIDILFLGVTACCLWHGQFRTARRSPAPRITQLLLVILAASLAVSVHQGLLPYPTPSQNAFASYYSPYNALRVARGFLWALILARPLHFLLRRQPGQARINLLAGVSTGLLGTGLVALWERGVVHDLFHARDRYDLLDGLLDFSTPYRVTGLFSGMHTGGEAIDGYLALAWPSALVLMLLPGCSRGLRLLAAVALPLGLYAVTTTFSRASYFALFVTLGVFSLGLAGSLLRRTGAGRTLAIVIGELAFLVCIWGVFGRGGTLALFALLAGHGACLGLGFLGGHLPRLPVMLLSATSFPLTMGLVFHALRSSKWTVTDTPLALVLAVSLPLIGNIVGLWAGRRMRGVLRPREFGVLALLGSTAVIAVVPALAGFRMETRFATAQSDLQMRSTHWREALALRAPGVRAQLFGAGLGTFPRAYFLAYPERLDGVALLAEEGLDTFLALSGGKDVKLVQRLPLPAHRNYRIALDYRLAAPEARLRIRLCRRQMIQPLEYNGDCVTVGKTLHGTHGAWAHFEADLSPGALGTGTGELGRAPLMLEIANRREYALMSHAPSVLELDRLSLRDDAGTEWLHNGDFSAGFDRWFTLYDFNHLPWHIKNMFVHLVFEHGFIGLAAVLTLTGVALWRGVRAVARGDIAAQAMVLGILGFGSVGMVGTLFDEPRILLLFLLFVLSLALAPANPFSSARH